MKLLNKIKPKSEPRKDWEKAFIEMHENGDDQLLINDVLEEEDFEIEKENLLVGICNPDY